MFNIEQPPEAMACLRRCLQAALGHAQRRYRWARHLELSSASVRHAAVTSSAAAATIISSSRSNCRCADADADPVA